MHDARQRTELLGDPEAHVGRAADDGGVRVAGAEVGERVFTGRRGEERLVVAGKNVGVVAKAGEEPGVLGGAFREGVVRLPGAARERGVRDRAVTGAAAEVPREPVVHRGTVRALPGVVEGEEAHHESGSAEAALRTVKIDHSALHGMQSVIG